MAFIGVGVVSQLSPPPLELLLEPLLAPLLLVPPLPLLELPLLELLLAPEELPDEVPLPLLELPFAPDELLEDPLPLELPPESASPPAGPLGRLGEVAQATKEQNPTRIEAGE